MEDAIVELTKLLIVEDLNSKNGKDEEYITFRKKDLIKFCIRLLKKIKNN